MDELLKQWRELTLARLEATDPIQAEIDALAVRLQEASQPFDDRLAELEKLITATALELGRSHEAHGVKVGYRKGYERVNWDGKALDGYMAAHPEITPFRSVTMVKPSVSIKAA